MDKCRITLECEAWDKSEEADIKEMFQRFVQELSHYYFITAENIEFIPEVDKTTPLFWHPV